MKTKKLLFGLGAVAIVATPIIMVTSCGKSEVKYYTHDGSKGATYSTSDIGGLKTTFGSLSEQISTKAQEINSSTDENKKETLNQPIIQITSAGVVSDNSFNQMTWEAISTYSNEIGVNTASYIQTKSSGVSEMHDAYNQALTKGYKIWVLTGWSQEEPFSSWIKKGNNKEKLEKNNVKIVAIDWDATNYVPVGQSLSLNFRTQESSFLIGYSVAEFLATNYPDSPDKRIVNTTSGADASGSTNFNYGFLTGIKAWNDNNSVKVSSNVYTNSSKVFLETTYIANDPATKGDFELSVKGEGTSIFKGPNPTVVMPVAGDWSKTAAQLIKDSNRTDSQWVVGVDSNMAKSYGSEWANYFITSSEKRIAIATFKALAFLTGMSNELSDSLLFPNSQKTNWTIDLETKKIMNNNILENQIVIGGIELDFVGASASTISDTEKASQFDSIVARAKEKWFGSSSQLVTNKAADKEKFDNALKEGNINQAVFEINNVLACGMTTNNKEFFNLIVDDINSWKS